MKKYIEYYFDDEDLNQEEIRESIIDEFFVKGSPTTSGWWKSLPKMATKIKSIHDWVADKQKTYLKDQDFSYRCTTPDSTRTMKTCPGVTHTVYNSYLIKAPTDIIITFDNNLGYVFNSSTKDKSLIKFSTGNPIQYRTEGNDLFKDKIMVKIELPIRIKTNKVPYVFLNPSWHNETFFDILPGAISDGYTESQPLNIQASMPAPKGDEPVTYYINAGDVLAYIWFPQKMELKYTPIRHHLKHFARKWSTKSRHSK
jgi:hypothetical protein